MFDTNKRPLGLAQEQALAQTNFLPRVFSFMALALSITALVAYGFATNQALLQLLINPETGSFNLFGYIVMFAPFILVMVMSLRFQRLSAMNMALLYTLFSVLMGMSLSFIFMVYTEASIVKTFFITSGMFTGMAFLGFTTKTDLTKMGSLLMMALFGIIIAMVVNMFMQSAMVEYIISIVGVLIFTGLTAYDVQKLKRLGSQMSADGELGTKVALMGALTLYLDFINLFLFLLRLFGNRK